MFRCGFTPGKRFDGWASLLPLVPVRDEDPARLGMILGQVTFVGWTTESESRWFVGPYGWLIQSAVALEEPIPYRGMLGIFPVALPEQPF